MSHRIQIWILTFLGFFISITLNSTAPEGTVEMKSPETESTPPTVLEQDCTECVFLIGGDELVSQEIVESFCPAETEHRIEEIFNLGTKGPVAGLLGNKILVSGGKLDDETVVTSAALYDPISRTLTRVEDMLHPRVYAAAVVLENTFYVCGGYKSDTREALEYCEKYSQNSWSPFASLQVKRCKFVMAELNGLIYSIGGSDGDTDLNSVESYNPSIGTWLFEQPFPATVSRGSGVTFENHVFVCGGYIVESYPDEGKSNRCYKYSDITKKWTEVSGLTKEKSFHSMVVAHGTMFVFYKYDVEMYNKHSDTWQLLDTQLTDYRRYSAAVTFPETVQIPEHVLIFGGYNEDSKQNIESYYPGNVTLNQFDAQFNGDRGSPIRVSLDNKKIFIAGGRGFRNGDTYTSAVLYEPISKQITNAENMIHARHSAAATAFNNTVIVCGGANDDDGIMDYCEKYDSSMWIPIAPMLMARKLFTMVELNGLIYSIGGYNREHLSSVESYYPKTDTWSSEPPLPARFCYPQAVAFENHIYLCGGKKDGTTTNECYKYSDITKKWISAPSLYKEQSGHSMVVACGTMFSFYKFGVEMYNKTLEKWVPIPSDLLFYRKHFSAITF